MTTLRDAREAVAAAKRARRHKDLVLRFVDGPLSQEIADILNELGESRCAHGRTACYTQCGVVKTTLGTWLVLNTDERRDWLNKMLRFDPLEGEG